MDPNSQPARWIGAHHHVVVDRRFDPNDAQEDPIENLYCLDCHALEPDISALRTRHPTCPHHPRS